MIALLATLLRFILHAFRSKRNILTENALLKKENEILARKMGKKRVHFDFFDKAFLVILHRAADIKYRLTLVKPETLLSWQRTLNVGATVLRLRGHLAQNTGDYAGCHH
jgi:hypothetical protein